MNDVPVAPWRANDNFGARDAAAEVDHETALALGRAAALTLKTLAPDLFRMFLQREIDRLKLAGHGTSDLTVVQLRAFLRD